MRRSLFYLVLLSVAWLGIGATEAQAQKYFFLKITNPEDSARFGAGATCAVTGFLQLPEPTTDIENFMVSVRVYGPGKQEFIIMNEALVKLNKPAPGKNRCTFEASLRFPADAGKYLLKVDCLDFFKKKNEPQILIATQSIFIDVPAAAKPVGKTVKINGPKDNDIYDYKAEIFTGGTSTESAVVKMRIRFTRITVIVKELVVDVSDGKWSGTLKPSTDGWPLGDASIQVQGLDSDSAPVTNESNIVIITIKKA